MKISEVINAIITNKKVFAEIRAKHGLKKTIRMYKRFFKGTIGKTTVISLYYDMIDAFIEHAKTISYTHQIGDQLVTISIMGINGVYIVRSSHFDIQGVFNSWKEAYNFNRYVAKGILQPKKMVLLA